MCPTPVRGRSCAGSRVSAGRKACRSLPMNQIIYIVGLIVVVIAVLSFFGMR